MLSKYARQIEYVELKSYYRHKPHCVAHHFTLNGQYTLYIAQHVAVVM